MRVSHQACHHCEAKTRALARRPGREEWIEDAFEDIRRYAMSVVVDFDRNVIIGGRTAHPQLEAPALRHCLGRVRGEVEKHQREFAAAKESAEQFLSVGDLKPPAEVDHAELAAWTSVARVLLNLHETVTRN